MTKIGIFAYLLAELQNFFNFNDFETTVLFLS